MLTNLLILFLCWTPPEPNDMVARWECFVDPECFSLWIEYLETHPPKPPEKPAEPNYPPPTQYDRFIMMDLQSRLRGWMKKEDAIIITITYLESKTFSLKRNPFFLYPWEMIWRTEQSDPGGKIITEYWIYKDPLLIRDMEDFANYSKQYRKGE